MATTLLAEPVTSTALRPGHPAAEKSACDLTSSLPGSWREAALLVLQRAQRPLRAQEIVDLASQWGLRPPSMAAHPAQSVNRDLHAAVRRGALVVAGPGPGQFHAPGVPAADVKVKVRHGVAPRGPRMAIEPLAAAIESTGGLALPRWAALPDRMAIARLTRTYRRSLVRGWIDMYDGDALVVYVLGWHPCMIWDEGWWQTLETLDGQGA